MENTSEKKTTGNSFPLLLVILLALSFATMFLLSGNFGVDHFIAASYAAEGKEGLLNAMYALPDGAEDLMAELMRVLSSDPSLWRGFSLAARALSGLFSWLLLTALFPKKPRLAASCSLLFVLFPLFSGQPLGYEYFPFWSVFALELCSLWLTACLIEESNKVKAFFEFFLVFVTEEICLLNDPRFAILEVLRFGMIFLALRKDHSWKRIVPAVVLMLYPLMAWYVEISLSVTLLSGTENVFRQWLKIAMEIFSEVFFGIWYRSLAPSEIELTVRSTQLALVLALAGGVVTFLGLRNTPEDDSEPLPSFWAWLALGCSALSFLLFMIFPSDPIETLPHDWMFSFWWISFFIAVWADRWFKSSLARGFLTAFLIFVCVFFHNRNTAEYRYSMKRQDQLQTQLKTRVPELAKETALIFSETPDDQLRSSALGALILEMYGNTDTLRPVPYWAYSLSESSVDSELLQTPHLEIDNHLISFSYDHFLLVVPPKDGACLWIPDEDEALNPYLDEKMKSFLHLQKRDRIEYATDDKIKLGSDWCFLYEQAELSLQRDDPEAVMLLYEAAETKGLHYGNPTEMRPFIEAAVLLGEREKAAQWLADSREAAGGRADAYFDAMAERLGLSE